LADPARIVANEILETPYLDRNLFIYGGVQLIWSGLNSAVKDKLLVPNQADVIYFSGHGEEDGIIYLRWNRDPSFEIDPVHDLMLDRNWNVDVDVVILTNCQTLSLCDDIEKSGAHDVGGDPRCKVSDGDTILYDANISPTDLNCNNGIPNTSCQQHDLPAPLFGGQVWRKLTVLEGNTIKGPQLYLGYYATAFWDVRSKPNLDTSIIRKFMWDVSEAGGLGQFPINKNDIINAWLYANINSEDDAFPAAAIDATNLNQVKYYAVVYDKSNNKWYTQPSLIYNIMLEP